MRRLLAFAGLRVAAAAIGIDSIKRHPGMILFAHHDRRGMERLAERAAARGRPLRTVDERTAVMPLDERVLGDADALLDLLGSLLRRATAPAKAPPTKAAPRSR